MENKKTGKQDGEEPKMNKDRLPHSKKAKCPFDVFISHSSLLRK